MKKSKIFRILEFVSIFLVGLFLAISDIYFFTWNFWVILCSAIAFGSSVELRIEAKQKEAKTK